MVYKKHGTYADNNFIYLVDLMFMYIKTISSQKIEINKLLPQLKIKDWGNVSPLQVIKNKNVSPNDYNRLAKAYLKENKYIRAYVIDSNTMKKFIISKKKGNDWKPSDWNYYESLTKKDIEKMYKDRFFS